MDENITEKEQLEKLRKWWDENGNFVVAGLVLGAVILFGWNYYKKHRINQAENASALHEALMEAIDADDPVAAQAAATQLQSAYGRTAYARQAPLALAKLHAEAGDLDAAAEALRKVVDSGGDVAEVARLRLARLHVAAGRPQEALDLLAGQAGEHFGPLYDEVRGDAHAALGDRAAAQSAYQSALDAAGTALDRGYVQMKLDSLGLAQASE